MTDHVAPDRRSAIMSAVRGKHTVPEMLVRRAAHRLGLRFRLHRRDLPGRPDLVLSKYQTVIFVNGCFWHRHTACKLATVPRTNTDFWLQKFEGNVRRDTANYARLTEMGWKVVILWQCEIGRPGTIERAADLLRARFRFTRRPGRKRPRIGAEGAPRQRRIRRARRPN